MIGAGGPLTLALAAIAIALLALRADAPVLRTLGLAVAALLFAVAVQQVLAAGGFAAWRGMRP